MPELEIGAGDVLITLDGKEMRMRPSLGTAMAISQLGQGQGLQGVLQKVIMLDLDLTVKIVGIAIGKQSKQLSEAVYSASGKVVNDQGVLVESHGLLYVTPLVIRFLHILMRGGQPLPILSEGGEGEDSERPPKTETN